MSHRFGKLTLATIILLVAMGFVAGLVIAGCQGEAAAQGGGVPELGLVRVAMTDVGLSRYILFRDDARQTWVYVWKCGFAGGLAVLPYSVSVDPRGGE